MRYIIDRFEGIFAICENEKQQLKHLPRNQIPSDALEGDTLMESKGTYFIDKEASLARRKKMQKKMQDLFE